MTDNTPLPQGPGDGPKPELLQNEFPTNQGPLPPAMVHREHGSKMEKADK